MDYYCVGRATSCSLKNHWIYTRVQSKNMPLDKLCVAARSSVSMSIFHMNKSRSYKISRVKFSSLHLQSEQQSRRTWCACVSVDEDAHLSGSEESSEVLLPEKPDSEQLKTLYVDSERKRLIKKLSEANQHNRFLKRQLLAKDDDLVNIKSDLAFLELEVQGLLELAEEIAGYGIQPGSRKINGKYIQSHLVSKLEVVQEKIKKQIKDVEAVKLREITLYWIGMAESVKVMGSFDGWSQGEEMSQEYTGAYIKFSADLKLRPGRYEIKFLVDEEWQLSPELPTVGEGLMENNILVVE